MSGRRAFRGLAPAGYRIRMMEPGEAPALRAVEHRAAQLLVDAGHVASAEPTPMARFVPFLLRHEVFVAQEKDGEPVGYAAAVDLAALAAPREGAGEAGAGEIGAGAGAGEGDGAGEGAGCYWLSELSVDPAHGRRGVGSALLAAVTARAGWFFHRAVGLSTARDVAFNETFYARRGFLKVGADDLTPVLRRRLALECPAGVSPERRTVMIRWL